MAINVKPLGDRVLVQPLEEKEVKKGGIIIPDTAKEKPQEGTVVAVGTGKLDDNGNKIEFNVKVGDKVLISKYGGTEIKIDGEKYLIMREDDILGIIGPALKQAFEQIYGPPYLARILFAEIGGSQEEDLFVRLDYDGSMHANSISAGKRRESFGAIAGTRRGLEQVEGFLRRAKISNVRSALETAVRAWGVALYTSDEDHPDAPEEPALKEFMKSSLEHYSVEAALLERGAAKSYAAFVEVPECDLENVLSVFR